MGYHRGAEPAALSRHVPAQVRQVCTHSCGAGRVAGISLPSFADHNNSFAEMQARIDKTVDFLKGLRAEQLDGKEDTVITVPIGGQPRESKCQNYLYHFAMLQVSSTRRRRTTSSAAPASPSVSPTISAKCHRKSMYLSNR
jgi:Domain of unknown function (DUF1993)